MPNLFKVSVVEKVAEKKEVWQVYREGEVQIVPRLLARATGHFDTQNRDSCKIDAAIYDKHKESLCSLPPHFYSYLTPANSQIYGVEVMTWGSTQRKPKNPCGKIWMKGKTKVAEGEARCGKKRLHSRTTIEPGTI